MPEDFLWQWGPEETHESSWSRYLLRCLCFVKRARWSWLIFVRELIVRSNFRTCNKLQEGLAWQKETDGQQRWWRRKGSHPQKGSAALEMKGRMDMPRQVQETRKDIHLIQGSLKFWSDNECTLFLPSPRRRYVPRGILSRWSFFFFSSVLASPSSLTPLAFHLSVDPQSSPFL